ncbi:hypothetical protein CONLIGDRAFT_639172 [Coniochaeta ligniaria NRRL 30616]|uniref:Uncharacterized protein n=1 Tax=Coniochaeta ligniaria NRRL 30616 TaxID=1408157 RepID=A0A1J7J5T8_9PEZI|nr:hypothetical protein CONLIGDRAFT_639172 [Coniochaeta ligniaria NRRL 30616]
MSLKLEDFIAEGDNANWSIGFPSTTKGMIKTGFHEWGFVIYRCVYGDDEAWQRYMKYFEDVIEALDGASIDAVREKFVAWRDEHMVELEVSFEKRMMPMAKDPPPRLPRFTYCLYVDQKCLNTVAAFAELFPRAHRFAPIPPALVAALIDGDFEKRNYTRGGSRAGPRERGQFPPVDGLTCRYVGWEYVNVEVLGDLYDTLHHERLDDEMHYKRPPKIVPLGYEAMTDNGVERV